MQGKSEAKRRLLANVSTNIIALLVSVLVGLWLTPYLIRNLGIEAYGMVPLVVQVVNYFAIFSVVLRDVMGRFVGIHLSRQEYSQSNIYFNTGLFSALILCVLLCIPVIVITALLPSMLNIPEGHVRSTRQLFFLVATSCFLDIMSHPFLVSPFIKHRFDLSNLVTILSRALRIAILVLCFNYLNVSLKYVGWSYCGMTLFVLGGSIWLMRQLSPQLHIRWSSFRQYALREMAGMGTWMTINQIGSAFYLGSSLIVINILLGPAEGGRYGPFVLLLSLLSMVGRTVASVFTPIAYEYIAHKEQEALVYHTGRSTRFLGLIIALPVGLLCGLSTPFLTWWLGPSFADLGFLLCLLVGPWLINVAVRPQFAVYRGMNKVKVPAIVVLIGGALNVLLSMLLIKYTRLGLYGVALAMGFCLTGKNMFFTPIYVAMVLGRSKFLLFRDFVFPVVMGTSLGLAGFGLSQLYELSSTFSLGTAAILLSIVYLLVCWIAMNKKDKKFLLSLVGRSRKSK